jgi:plasmid stability protein
VKNITVSVPDEIYRLARIRAAEAGTSVSALVADYLQSLSRHKEEFERLAQQQRRITTEIEAFRASDRLGRGELHRRAVR